jgi:hypothetical protein
MYWNELFTYKEGELYWKAARPGCWDVTRPAGSDDNRGYRRVRVDGKKYSNHRIIWEMFNGAIPEGMQVDHINHDRADNKVENLRLVTRELNQRNQKKHCTNTSGVTGVSYVKRTGRWAAYVYVKGKLRNLGTYPTVAEAAKVREAAIKGLEGYHNNHGA